MSNDRENVFVGSSAEGKAKVEAGNYAFFAESTFVEYVTARECELMQVGGLLDTKGYGIGLPTGNTKNIILLVPHRRHHILA